MDKKVLLIADDEEMNRRIITKFLKNEYTVIEAENGKAAMEKLLSVHVDALLLDIIMPEMDGLEVLQEMKEHRVLDHVGVMVATSTKEKTERTALQAGADDIVSKPYDPMVIKKRLQNILIVKELGRKGELLEKSDYDTLMKEKMSELNQRITKLTDQIETCAQIITANKENYPLVGEMTDEIKQLAEKVVKLTLPEN